MAVFKKSCKLQRIAQKNHNNKVSNNVILWGCFTISSGWVLAAFTIVISCIQRYAVNIQNSLSLVHIFYKNEFTIPAFPLLKFYLFMRLCGCISVSFISFFKLYWFAKSLVAKNLKNIICRQDYSQISFW